MPVFRPVVHREQDARARQALDEAVQERLCLAVDPVQVLEEQHGRARPAFPE